MKRKIIFLTFGLSLAVLPALGSDFHSFFKPQILPLKMGFQYFVDPLPLPPHIQVGDQTEITIHLTQFSTQLHRDLPTQTTMWGYNGSSPGPVIDVEQNHKLTVHWQNDLPTKHILKAPAGMMTNGPVAESRIVYDGAQSPPPPLGEMPQMGPSPAPGNLPEVRNITHLHGAAVSETHPMDRLHNNDGWPDAWNVPGQEQIAEYPNTQDARSLWYHDHAFGETGRNVAAGLYGMYLIHDEFERSLNLPSGKFEIPLIFQTVLLKSGASLNYTDLVSNEFYGNALAVNGKLVPFLNVEPRKYRFRMLNASNAREYGLHLVDPANQNLPGPAFYQIGTDAGFLEDTAVLNDPEDPKTRFLYLASAERADVIVDFSKYAGRSFILTNSNALTDPDGEIALSGVMKINVASAVTAPDTSSLPTHIRTIEKLDPAQAAQTRQIVMGQTDFPSGLSLFQFDNRSWLYPKTDVRGDYFDYEINHKPVLGTTEVWELINTTTMIHPFHVHLVEFQILDRTPFDVDQYKLTGKINFTGPPVPPDANEAGWKDVVRANQRFITRIIMRFDSYTGYYVYHCHILEHEDMDMMVPFQVVEKP